MGKLSNSAFAKEFKTFISQGNVMDLAVGMIIGTAFSSIVSSLVNDVIMPVVGLIAGGVDFTDLQIKIDNFFGGDTAAIIRYGNFIQNVVNFLIVAFSLFLVIRFLNHMNERAKEARKRAEKRLGIASDEEDDKKAAEEKKEKAAEKAEAKAASDEQTKLLKDILKELKKSKK